MLTSDIISALAALKGVTFVGITMETDVKLKGGKGNPYQGRVTKLAEVVAMVAKTREDVSVYENAVNKRLAAEGKEPNFEAGRLPWGKWKDGFYGLIIEHPSKTDGMVHDYIRLAVLKTVSSQVLLDGKPILKEDVDGYPEAKSEGNQGGLSEENKLFIRSVKVGNIHAIRAFGEEVTA